MPAIRIKRGILSLIVGITAIGSLVPHSARADATANTFYYFVDVPGGAGTAVRLNYIDLLGPNQRVPVYTTSILAPNTGQANGVAYDTKADGVIFANNSDPLGRRLWFLPERVNSPIDLGLSGASANLTSAAYYNGAYYSVMQLTNTLYKVPVNYDINNVPTGLGASSEVSITGLAARAYGDIAINPQTGILYGVTTTSSGITESVTFAYDLNTSQLLGQSSNPTAGGLQISFNSDFSTLYGIDANGAWSTIDISDPASASFGTRVSTGLTTPSGTVITDIAGTTPVPGPLPVLGMALAFRATRKLRKALSASRVSD